MTQPMKRPTDEPKKSELEAAAKRKWPSLTGTFINHRKHSMQVRFGKDGRKDPFDFVLKADSHRELLHAIEKA